MSKKMARPTTSRALPWLLAAALVLLTLATFWPVLGHDFVNYDDDKYILENPTVRAGLSAANVKWAFAGSYAANWHPLTWLSHMLDVELYGMQPSGHHLSSLVLHVLGTLALFGATLAATSAPRRSALVAALFAVHPMHVESVAWVAERKDVLSGLFWMLTLAAYALYARRPSLPRYLGVFVALGLGLMAKPMLVTLPLVLLMLDYWPLRRKQAWSRLLLEKVPLLGLALAAAIVTVLAQRGGSAVSSFELFSPGIRIANAVLSYGVYLGQLLWPANMAVFYPHPGETISWLHVALAATILVAISAWVLRPGGFAGAGRSLHLPTVRRALYRDRLGAGAHRSRSGCRSTSRSGATAHGAGRRPRVAVGIRRTRSGGALARYDHVV